MSQLADLEEGWGVERRIRVRGEVLSVRGRKESGGNRGAGMRMSRGGHWTRNLGRDDNYLMNVLGMGTSFREMDWKCDA
jgi:hypothetical protein